MSLSLASFQNPAAKIKWPQSVPWLDAQEATAVWSDGTLTRPEMLGGWVLLGYFFVCGFCLIGLLFLFFFPRTIQLLAL